MAWPNFQLLGETTYRTPKTAIRDGHTAYYETKPKSGDPDAETGRLVEEVTCHVDCNTFSTGLSDYVDFITAAYITDLQAIVSDGTRQRTIVHLGNWRVVRVSTNDHGNGTSTVRFTAQQKDNPWIDMATA